MATPSIKPEVTCLMHNDTNTCNYVVIDPSTKHCAIIDAPADFALNSGSLSYEHAQTVVDFVKEKDLKVDWILETHVHADHISAAPFLKEKLSAPIGIGANISMVQEVFSKIFELDDLPCDGSQFDQLFKDGDELQVGSLTGRVIYTPGHTPACVSYHIGDCVFIGDTLFMPDVGSARCDFPMGSATGLWHSIHKLFALPSETRMFVGHDYPPKDGGRGFEWEASVKRQYEKNKHFLNGEVSKQKYIEMRTTRDASLNVPRYLLPALQCNIRTGLLPEPSKYGTVYLKLPINLLGQEAKEDISEIKPQFSSTVSKKLSDEIYICASVTDQQLKDLAEEGVIKSVVNLVRTSERLFSHSEEELLKELGIPYFHFPVGISEFGEENAMNECLAAIDSAPKPVLIHCAAMTRAAALGIMHSSTRCQQEAQELIEFHGVKIPPTLKNMVVSYAAGKLEVMKTLPKFEVINDNLIVGPQFSEEELYKLKIQYGIKSVLNMRSQEEAGQIGFGVLPNEKDLVESLSLNYCHVPTSMPITKEETKIVSNQLGQLEPPVLMHCSLNVRTHQVLQSLSG